MTTAATLVRAARNTTDDVIFGTFLCGPGPARRGWFRRTATGIQEFLGRNLADVRERNADRALVR